MLPVPLIILVPNNTLPPKTLPATDNTVPKKLVPVMVPAAEINPPVKILPPVTLPLALINPVTYSPVVAQTTTFDVPAIDKLALPFATSMSSSVVPLTILSPKILPLNVALPVTLRSPVIATKVGETTITFAVPFTPVEILPFVLVILTFDVPLEMAVIPILPL